MTTPYIKLEVLGRSIDCILGSSSLLAENTLPVSKSERVQRLRELFPDFDSFKESNRTALSEEDARVAYEALKDLRVKKGCFKTNFLDILFGLKSVPAPRVIKERVPRAPGEPKPQRQPIVLVKSVEEALEKYTVLERKPAADSINIFGMNGTSATGKGTRLFQLVKYLFFKQDLKYVFVNNNSKFGATIAGYYSENLNLFIHSLLVRSNKSAMLSMSSYDRYQALVFGEKDMDTGGLFKLLNKEFGIKNLALEGYPCYPDIYRLKEWFPETEFDLGAYIQYYVYPKDGFELLQERVVGRSGSRIKGTCWSGNTSTVTYANRLKEWVDEGNRGQSIICNFDDRTSIFGEMLLNQIKPELVPDFLKFCEENPVLRHVDEPEKSAEPFAEMYDYQITLQNYIRENNDKATKL